MKIYLDYIFLENLVVNTVIIIEIILFTNSNVSIRRRNIVIILDTFFSCVIYLIPQIDNYIFHAIFSSITLYILFRFKNIIEYIKKFLCYYLIYFIYIGMIITFSIVFSINLENIINKIGIYLFSGLVLHILVKELWKVWKSKIEIRDLCYILKIDNVEINSFVDTGNTVKEPFSKLDVIFIDKNLKQKFNCSKYKKTEFDVLTVNGIDKKEGYIVNNITVIKDEKIIANIPKIILCFSLKYNTPEKYSAIIGYETYLKNIDGGVDY